MAVLKIYGDIGESAPDFFMLEPADTVSAKDVSAFLDANKDAKEITVRINSRGGDVQEGWAIYDLLTTSGKTIKTIGEGKVYSIATIIFLAGSERSMLKNADGLIHNPFIPPYTLADAYESTDLLKIAESLAQEEEKILDFYAEKTGTDKAKLATYMKDETKLSAEDMLALGFATKIVEPVRAYAIFKPKNINTMATDAEKKTILDRFEALLQGDIAKAFSRLPLKNMELTDTAGNTFTVQKESGEPAVGDVAAPDGTYVMPDGKTIIVAGGVITEIQTAEAETEMDKVKKENDQLKAEIETLKANATAAETATAEAAAAKASYTANEAKALALIGELEALKNDWQPAGRSAGEGGKNKVDGIDLDRVKEVRERINNQKTDK